MVMYGLESTEATHAAGRGISRRSSDAGDAGKAVLDSLDATRTGEQVLDGAVDDLRADLVAPVSRLGKHVEQLGASTSEGATTAAQVTNESTGAQNDVTALARDVNATVSRPPVAR